MQTFSSVLAALAAVTHLSGYAAYARLAGRGKARLNTATWVLWAFLSSLNATSYLMMSGDPAKSAVAFAGAAACTVTLLYALRSGQATAVSGGDAAALVAGFAAAAAWLLLRSATYANLILQTGFLVSMIPTYRGVLRSPTQEPPLPWFLWGAAYVMILCVVLLRWSGNVPDLAYPCLNLVTHSGVGLLAVVLVRRRARA